MQKLFLLFPNPSILQLYTKYETRRIALRANCI